MRIRVVPAIIVAAVVALCFWAIQPASDLAANPAANVYVENDLSPVVTQVDEFFQSRWVDLELQPAARADDMLMLRRLSLSLMGTIPSLEEIRQFERDDGPDRKTRVTPTTLPNGWLDVSWALRTGRSSFFVATVS